MMILQKPNYGSLRPGLQKKINDIRLALAENKSANAFGAVTEIFESIKEPELVCADARAGQKNGESAFNSINPNMVAMALGSNGKYVREDNINWDSDVPIMTEGLLRGKIIKECIRRGRTFYHLNTGYLGNDPSTVNPEGKILYYRIVKNNLQHVDIPGFENESNQKNDAANYSSFELSEYYDGSRWEKLGIKIKEVESGKKILVIPPTEKVIQYFGLFGHHLDTWLEETVKTIKKYTNRPIEIRTKPPREERISTNKMEQALEDTHCLVAFNSISALEALIYGKPAIVLGPNCAQALCATRLDKIESLKHPGQEAVTWLCHYLANNQFTFDEMLNGYAWTKIK